jgi:hypothetical protein
MYRKIFKFMALAAVLLLLQCSDKPTQPEQVKLGELFTLTLGKTVEIKGEDLSLTFRSVLGDSRCPFGVLCFWQGIAEIEIKLRSKAGDTTLVTLGVLGGTRDNAENPYFVDTLGYRLTLLRLAPYPEMIDKVRLATPPPPMSEYNANLRIDHTPLVSNLTGSVTIINSPPDSIQLDYFAVDSVSIVGDTLSLAINYGGCCKNHYFFLFMSPASFFESSPVQANLYLRHFANYDACKCMGYRSLKFDLRPIADLYLQVYGVAEPIALNISEFTNSVTNKLFRLVYYPTGAQHNRAPVLEEIGSKSVECGDTLRFAVPATDPDGMIPSVSAVNLPRNASLLTTDSGSSIFSFSPDISQVGVHNILFYASDGEFADSEMVAIEVEEAPPAVNHAPVLAEIGSKSVKCGDTLRFAVSATDPDGTTPSVFTVNLPRNASLMTTDSGSSIFSFSPDASQVGMHNILFYASDGELADSEMVDVTVTEAIDHAPVLNIQGSRTVGIGATLVLVIGAFDSDGTTPVVTASGLPENTIFTHDTLTYYTLAFTPDSSQMGDHDILFVASDGSLADSETVTLHVSGTAPLIPTGVGNYWLYDIFDIDPDGGIAAAYDQLHITGSTMAANGQDVWWRWSLLSSSPPFGTEVMVRHDSVFSESGLEFIRATDQPISFAVASTPEFPGFDLLSGTSRVVSRLESVIVTAGIFKNCYRFERKACDNSSAGTTCYNETYVIAPGVGIVEIEFAKSVENSYELRMHWELASYKLEQK